MSGDIRWHDGEVPEGERHSSRTDNGCTIWITGLSGSGKSTIGHRVEAALVHAGHAAYTLDGDNLRHGLNSDLTFSPEDRTENVRRVGEVARLMADAGLVAIAPLISPYESDRESVRSAHKASGTPFYLVFVSTPVDVCELRDTKGLYAKARAGDIKDFTGVSAPYEVPTAPDLIVDTTDTDLDETVAAIIRLVS